MPLAIIAVYWALTGVLRVLYLAHDGLSAFTETDPELEMAPIRLRLKKKWHINLGKKKTTFDKKPQKNHLKWFFFVPNLILLLFVLKTQKMYFRRKFSIKGNPKPKSVKPSMSVIRNTQTRYGGSSVSYDVKHQYLVRVDINDAHEACVCA
jgi:hypothetical protein